VVVIVVVVAVVVVAAAVVVVSPADVVTARVVVDSPVEVGTTTSGSVELYSRDRMPLRSVTAARDGSRSAGGPAMVPSRPLKVTPTPWMAAAVSCSSTWLVRLFSMPGIETARAIR
jgi:hypothetical protein